MRFFQPLTGHSYLPLGLSATPERPVPRLPPLWLTWVLTRLERKLRVTSNCTAAAAPCPATARRNPGLMVTSAARSWGTAGRRDDDGWRQCPGTGSLQDSRSARRPQDGNALRSPVAATDVPALRAPASFQEAPPPASSVVITPSVQSLLGVVVPASPAPTHPPTRYGKALKMENYGLGRRSASLRRGSAAANEAGPRGLQNTQERAGERVLC